MNYAYFEKGKELQYFYKHEEAFSLFDKSNVKPRAVVSLKSGGIFTPINHDRFYFILYIYVLNLQT